jgi:hypothetical protein
MWVHLEATDVQNMGVSAQALVLQRRRPHLLLHHMPHLGCTVVPPISTNNVPAGLGLVSYQSYSLCESREIRGEFFRPLVLEISANTFSTVISLHMVLFPPVSGQISLKQGSLESYRCAGCFVQVQVSKPAQ